MNIATDEYGNPFLIVREQQQKQRLQGQAAHRANILAACAVADTLRSSLGPKGMDKVIVSPDGQVTVTNDGATILSKMNVEHQCARLLVELSQSQDAEIGDGTTGVVVLAGALLTNALQLLVKGLHPLKIADGYEKASQIAVARLEEVVLRKDVYGADRELLVHAASTALGSKVVSSQQRHLAEVCVQAVLSVADRDRGDVNFELIKVDGKAGSLLEDSRLLQGVVLHKEFSHSQMKKEVKDAKIAILTCPFEPPKPKIKHKLDIRSVEDYQKLQAAEQKYFSDMVQKVKDAGANVVICQWGFDDEANHLLLHEDLPAIRWVGGAELEMVAIATGGRIVPRWQELSADKLGSAAAVREISSGTVGDKFVVIEGCGKSAKAVTVVVCAGNQMVVAEAERCMHDALCVVRNLLRDPRVVGGGGAAELCAAIAVEAAADKIAGVEQFSVRAFADALTSVAEALADNCGLNAIEEVQKVKSLQITQNYPYFGLDCMQKGTRDMLTQNVLESYSSKVNQILLAAQVVKMILKIDDVIVPNDI